MKPATVVVLLAALAVAALFIWETRILTPVAIDDAYITFSYSKNLATGHGPVYGHGERVEGYSNFLWMVAVALGLLVSPRGADPLLVARATAIPFVALLGFATYRLARARASRVLSIAVLVVLALAADVGTAFLMGLETLPAMAFLMLGFWLYVRSIGADATAGDDVDRARLGRWVVPAFVGVALSRIDGFIPLGFILGFEALRRLLRREGSIRDYVVWAAPGVLVYGIWFLWRWRYYGLPLPTTYYAKALIPKLLPHRGWEYIRDEMGANGSLALVPLALLALAARKRLAALLLLVFAALHLAYVRRAGGDWMPYGRFVLPLLPVGLVLTAWGGQWIADALGRVDGARLAERSPSREGSGTLPGFPTRRRLGRASLVLLLVPLAAMAFVVHRTERHITTEPLQQMKLALAAEQGSHVKNLKAAARILTWALPPGARLVTDYGGIFAYYTDAAPIEMWGLCNAAIARRGGTERVNPIYGRTCPECYPALAPQFFHVMVPIVRDLAAFHSHFEVVASVWQTDTIGRYMDFSRGFVTGRVMVPAHDQAVYFLEHRNPGASYRPRQVNDWVTIDYPFEPMGRAPGL